MSVIFNRLLRAEIKMEVIKLTFVLSKYIFAKLQGKYGIWVVMTGIVTSFSFFFLLNWTRDLKFELTRSCTFHWVLILSSLKGHSLQLYRVESFSNRLSFLIPKIFFDELSLGPHIVNWEMYILNRLFVVASNAWSSLVECWVSVHFL